MTHKDIYTKFMIEYDKANVTSSYPSLTEYEVATVLDKAYNALIAQKITGNNLRRATFEADTKAIADLEPLVRRESKSLVHDEANVCKCDVPEEMLYYITSYLKQTGSPAGHKDKEDNKFNPYDNVRERIIPVRLVDHNTATKFFSTSYNMPWIKTPVCYIENQNIYFVYDPLNPPTIENGSSDVVYIKKPNTFVKDLSVPTTGWVSYFDPGVGDNSKYQFECNDTVAEELISLAVAFALENVESQRLNSKLNMRGLEA